MIQVRGVREKIPLFISFLGPGSSTLNLTKVNKAKMAIIEINNNSFNLVIDQKDRYYITFGVEIYFLSEEFQTKKVISSSLDLLGLAHSLSFFLYL